MSWWKEKDNPHVMFATYEDMIKDVSAVIHQVAAFVGKTLTDEQVARITTHTGFEAMSKNGSVIGDFNKVVDNKICPFMRKGKVGDWKNHFTQKESNGFDQLYTEQIVGTGLEHILSDGN